MIIMIDKHGKIQQNAKNFHFGNHFASLTK